MNDEMHALEHNGTWDLVHLPPDKKPVCCHCQWVYAIKVGPDKQIDYLKARPMAKDYTHIYGFDYGDTFSLVVKITSIRLLIAITAIDLWLLYHLDIKNVFLY